jgi:hypothetical protein
MSVAGSRMRVPVPGWQDQIVARPDGGSGAANADAAWRLAVAARAARAYAAGGKLAALAAARSVGAGLADRFSDLELDCYWADPPGDLDRSGPVRVLGGDLEALWEYDPLVAAVVQRSLRADVLQGWAAREALASRGDDLAVQDLLSRAGHAVFGAVLALNGVYFPHHTIKWQSHLISELDVMPGHFAERLGLLGAGATAQALREAETLLADTVQLVQARTDADISSFCDELSQRRRAVDPPSAEHRSAPP